MTLTIGAATPAGFWSSSFADKQTTLSHLSTVGVDQVFIADHVSFRNGSGTDGFVEIAALSQLHPSMDVMIGVYLLALRHPLPVARQLATMATVAPGRMTLGVGIGGEDRHEIEICGVDPRTRGRRTNECLEILRALMTGEPLDYDGEFFQLDAAQIRPALDPPIPLIIGGRSNAALERTGRYGDGWLGAWCSPRRFAEAVGIVNDVALDCGRSGVQWQHGYQPWIGVGDTPEAARSYVAAAMESFYSIPFETFEKYVPYGTPEMIAEALQPYVDAGCSTLNLQVVGESAEASLHSTGEIVRLLRSHEVDR